MDQMSNNLVLQWSSCNKTRTHLQCTWERRCHLHYMLYVYLTNTLQHNQKLANSWIREHGSYLPCHCQDLTQVLQQNACSRTGASLSLNFALDIPTVLFCIVSPYSLYSQTQWINCLIPSTSYQSSITQIFGTEGDGENWKSRKK